MSSSDSFLDVGAKWTTDDSIKSIDYTEYQPIVGSRLNTSGQIDIIIENSDDFYLPHRSWILFEGKLVKNDNTPYEDADNVTLTNNGILYLFTNISYKLNGTLVESLNHPGHAITILNSVKNTSTFNKSSGLAQCWVPDSATEVADNTGFKIRQSYIIKKPNSKGSFSFMIPLESILGFAEDHKTVTYGMRHSITFSRAPTDNDAIYRVATAALAGKVELTKISWMMPKVVPNDIKRLSLLKTIGSDQILDLSFRMRQCCLIELQQATTLSWKLGLTSMTEKPRWIIVGLQTDKINDQTKNASLFNHCKVTNMSIILNGVKYPSFDTNADFENMRCMPFYHAFTSFTRDFYGLDPLTGGANVNPAAYQELTPLFVFDLTKQSERLKSGNVDVSINMQFKENPPANSRAYALVINDRMWNIRSNGRNMEIQY